MPEKLLNAELIKQIKLLFETQLIYPVEIIYFTDKDESESCAETRQLLEELCRLSEKLSFQQYEIHDHPQLAQKINVSLTPGLVIASRERDELLDYGIRFAGIPSGYEFGSLIHAIEMVSKRDSGLKPETRLNLKDIQTPVLLQVFVTPT
jgi:alkyl hydroperoxide reductase subunit AhpF